MGEIIRETHGEIYAGNVKGHKVKKMVDDYTEKYKSHTYKSKEDEMEDITAEDVQEEMRTLKETAGGMDQWTPADLELLPLTTCKSLAHMFNAIEAGQELNR